MQSHETDTSIAGAGGGEEDQGREPEHKKQDVDKHNRRIRKGKRG